MNPLKIVSADERLAAKSSIKGVILGVSGIGKTTLLRTLDPATTLAIDLEAGMLAVQDYTGASMSIRSWEDARDLAAFIGGPNPAMRPEQSYSQAHYDHAVKRIGSPEMLAKFSTVFVDSITVASRLAFQWAKGQPAAFNKDGVPDIRGAYGLLGQEMIGWLTQLQHTPGKNVWFVGILDRKTDDFNRVSWEPQIEGGKASRELAGIVDQVISMVELKTAEGQPYRAFVTKTLNEWGYPAKDRSGRLDPIEEPNLGKLMNKISAGARQDSLLATALMK